MDARWVGLRCQNWQQATAPSRKRTEVSIVLHVRQEDCIARVLSLKGLSVKKGLVHKWSHRLGERRKSDSENKVKTGRFNQVKRVWKGEGIKSDF